MTEKRKQELRRLLEEAKGSLEVRHDYDAARPFPEDLYSKYLQERWEHFGLDRFSPFWIRLTLDIGCETAKSRLLEFIREELTPFLGVDGDSIKVAVYFIEHHSTNGPRLNRVDDLLRTIDVDFILTRLLDIALVRGEETGGISVRNLQPPRRFILHLPTHIRSKRNWTQIRHTS